jgi:hypothetical protein
MPAPAAGARVAGAFALTLAAALFALVAGVVVTAGVSSRWSARAAGDALLWRGAGQLLATVAFVAAFRALARRWAGVPAPAWATLLLGVLVLAAAAVLFVLAMVLMNR